MILLIQINSSEAAKQFHFSLDTLTIHNYNSLYGLRLSLTVIQLVGVPNEAREIKQMSLIFMNY